MASTWSASGMATAASEGGESMDTFYQIAVIGLIISNVVLWMLFIGLIGATKLTLQKLKEALEECRR